MHEQFALLQELRTIENAGTVLPRKDRELADLNAFFGRVGGGDGGGGVPEAEAEAAVAAAEAERAAATPPPAYGLDLTPALRAAEAAVNASRHFRPTRAGVGRRRARRGERGEHSSERHKRTNE